MHFKLFVLSLSAFVFMSGLMCGCAGESSPRPKAIDFRLSNNASCLSEMAQNIESFIDGKMDTHDVDFFWSCVKDSLREFQRLTSGEEDPSRYSPEALRRFLIRYFFKGKIISDSFLSEIMGLKRLFLGGLESELTREEVTKLIELMDVFRQMSQDVHPHVLILFSGLKSRVKENYTDDELRTAGQEFRKALVRLGHWLQKNNQDYTFVRLSALVDELSKWSGNSHLIKSLSKGLKVLPPSKRILVGGQEKKIGASEWLPLMDSMGQGYFAFMTVQQVNKKNIVTFPNRKLIPWVLKDLAEILKRGLERNDHQQIESAVFEHLFEQLYEAGWLEDKSQILAISELWGWLNARYLNVGPSRLLGEALGQAQVSRLNEISQLWLELLEGLGQDIEFSELTQNKAWLNFDLNNRLVFSSSADFKDQKKLIFPFVLLQSLRTSYVGQEKILTLQTVALAVGEILPILHKFGWLTDVKPEIALRLLREADLFTNSGNGNGQLELIEGMQYLMFVMSAYQSSEVWLSSIQRFCKEESPECARQLVFHSAENILTPLPGLVATVGSQQKLFLSYMAQGEETVLGKIKTEPFTQGDLIQVWMLFQYVEMFYLRFDQVPNHAIDVPEATFAYVTYGPTLGQILSATPLNSDEIFAFFTFMMRYGDTPFTAVGGQTLFLNWKWRRSSWAFAAERPILMSILNQLSKF